MYKRQVLAEINGFGPDGKPVGAYTELKDDGSTSCGCWIYCGVRADGVNQAARRKPRWEQPDRTALEMLDGTMKGYVLFGQNPAVGSSNSRLHRLALARLDWLVVRDLYEIESATFWYEGPEVETGELRPEECGTEVFFLPAAAHVEKDGSFTNTQRLLQWHTKAVEPAGDRRSDLWFAYHLGRRIREKLAGSAEPRDRPVQQLRWELPTEGPLAEPSAAAVLREINGADAEGRPLASFTELQADGSTACGCWIYCGVYAGDDNRAARRTPHWEQGRVPLEWAWSWPSNRRILYNRASADPAGGT